MKTTKLLSHIFDDGRAKALGVLLCSVAAHASAFYLWNEPAIPPVLSSGSISAPVSLSFSMVSQPVEPEPEKIVEPQPDLIEEPKPEPILKPEIVEQSEYKITKVEPELEPEKEPELKPEPELAEQTEPELKEESLPEPEPLIEASATTESEYQGLNEIPVVTEPAFRKPPSTPDYPRQARRRNQEGAVLVEVLVDEAGETLDVEVIESSGYLLLDRAAVKAVSQWAFQPKSVGKHTVKSKVQVPVLFELRS